MSRDSTAKKLACPLEVRKIVLDGVELNLEECGAGSDLDDRLEAKQSALCTAQMLWILHVSRAKADRIYFCL